MCNSLKPERRLLRAVAGVVVAMAGLWMAAGSLAAEEASSALLSKGPYLQEWAPGSMSIMWETLTNLPGTVRYGLEGASEPSSVSVTPKAMRGISKVIRKVVVPVLKTNLTASGEARIVPSTKTNAVTESVTNTYYLYEVALEGLRLGQSYAYTVGIGGTVTPSKQFKPLNPEAERVCFIGYGDSRSDPKIHARLAAQFMDYHPDFILHTGDLVSSGRDYGLWSKEFFDPLTNVIDQVPLFSAIGNHEDDGTNYLGYFHLPGKRLWYSFDAGPVHVLVLDFRFEKSSSEQFRFASNDLARASAPWKLVMLHYPVFNLSGHSSGWGRANYLPLFHQTKVDLVLVGHSHLYERFRPLAPKTGGDEWPITHITSGGGGAHLHASVAHAALLARAATNHFLVFEATRDRLVGRALTARGDLLDRFEIAKAGGRHTLAYLAAVYSEGSLDIYSDVAPMLAGRVAELPGAVAFSKVTFNIAPLKTPKPAQFMDISLAPASVRFYTMENGPVRVAIPPPGATNRLVFAPIRYIGRRKPEGKGGEAMRPALVFQAKVRAGAEEILVYGAPCKLGRKPAETKTPSEEPDYED